ncbi:phage tail tube protein [Aeromicrobium phragmitis]|uniref:phage tail tube protein n=1 Tax=Aeromicrobium phragmitis TaxID=2478914 RepID=UPI00105D775A|nr:hypothetical protein [Aeromicrobium phragmitis]
MPVTTKVPLGAETLARKWCIDVNAGNSDTPDWVGVFGITEFKPTQSPTTQDTSDYDGEGWKSETVTAQSRGGEGKVKRASTRADRTAYDPGQEILRLAASEMGLDNEVEVRVYEDNGPDGPAVEAYQGFVGVTWEPDGGGMDAIDFASFKLLGHGKRTAIPHPAADTTP